MAKKWTVTDEISTAHLTQVFSGGACNIIDEQGNLVRNKERDAINDWLSSKGIRFYDPQIHPDTHDEEYDYDKHGPLEIAAREAAKINLYEVSPRTFGGVTSLEIAVDCFRWGEPTIIYFSDGDSQEDKLPEHSETGHPLFVPYGIKNPNGKAAKAHYNEMLKNANNMRRYIIHFARQLDSLTVHIGDTPRAGDLVITPTRISAGEIFEAVVKASANERTHIYFTGDFKEDEMGNPQFHFPPDISMVRMNMLLDQYVDDGSELRRRISKLMGVNVYMRLVYTQKSAILALEELLTLRGLLP